MRHRLNSRGFTLIEVVIAVSILSIILTMSYSSLNFIIRTKKLLDDRRDIGSIANAVLLRVSREIQLAQGDRSLIPPVTGLAAGTVTEKLQGESKTIGDSAKGDKLTFGADNAGQYVPGGATNAGRVNITYRVEKDPDSPKGSPTSYLLIRDEKPDIRPVKDAYAKTMTFPIAKNVVGLQFSYYDQDKNRWQNEWVQQPGMPGLIRMVLKLRSPAGAEYEYMTVLPLRAQLLRR